MKATSEVWNVEARCQGERKIFSWFFAERGDVEKREIPSVTCWIQTYARCGYFNPPRNRNCPLQMVSRVQRCLQRTFTRDSDTLLNLLDAPPATSPRQEASNESFELRCKEHKNTPNNKQVHKTQQIQFQNKHKNNG